MDDTSPTQKQRAAQYSGNLGYFRGPHYLRSIRLWSFVAVLLLSLGAVASYRFWKRDTIFSKGALSQGHARLAQDCRACHADGQTDALKARLTETHGGRSLPGIVKAAFSTTGAEKGSPHTHSAGMSPMDQACMNCHPGFGLHLPQTAGLKLRSVAAESVTVHAEDCFVCHREHAGSARMSLPDAGQCAVCHNSVDELNHHRETQTLANPPIAAGGENRNLGDGLVTFITPSNPKRKPIAFSDFANGHPAFAYEAAGMKDPTPLKFNHARHLRPDLSGAGKQHALDCTDCHAPGPGGNFKQPVTYEQHCKQCHTLQILPNLPKLRIPHHDSEKVRWFLSSVRIPIENALRAEGVTEGDLAKRADTEMEALRLRGLRSLEDLEQRVFFEGDPKDDPNNRRMREGNAKFLTECAKCHEVAKATVDQAPAITPPNMAMRWLQKGQFNHQPHSHVACTDCHSAAKTSKLTSDILLPTQKSCAECHRAPGASMPSVAQSGPDARTTRASATFQREHGGVKWDCQACHVFHAPVMAPVNQKPATPARAAASNTPAR